MLSAVIASGHSYRAMLLAEQLIHHRSVHPGPLVLGAAPLKSPAHVLDRDRTVSRRSEPSSRTALMGEQPNPWEVLPPQDATSRHRAISAVTGGADYLSTLHPIGARGRRLMATIDFIRARMRIAISPLVVERISRYRVMPKRELQQTSHGVALALSERSGSTVISRNVDGVSTASPQMLRCQTTPSL